MRLCDKRCLIVGGTSGIGLAAAKRFLEEGAQLVIAGHDEAQGQTALDQLAGRQVHFVRCDATVSIEVEALGAQCITWMKGLDVLYHVAGGSGRRFGDGALHECSDEGFRWTVDANLTSTFLTNRLAVRHFLANRQPGVILNMASVLALAPSPGHFDTAAYAAAKERILKQEKQPQSPGPKSSPTWVE